MRETERSSFHQEPQGTYIPKSDLVIEHQLFLLLISVAIIDEIYIILFSSVGNYNWHDHIYLITFSPKLELVITNVLANFANNFISWIEVTVLDLHLPLTGWVTLSKLLIMPPFPLLFNNSRHREQQISVKRIKYLFCLGDNLKDF